MKIRIAPFILPIITMLLIACNPQVELTGTPFHKGQTVSLSASIGHSTATPPPRTTD